MKLLLTSNGITNDTIAKSLESLLDKSVERTKVAFIPTAALTDAVNKKDLIDYGKQLQAYGYTVVVVDIAKVHGENLQRILDSCDVICVGGGNPFYLSYWMKQSGMFAMLPELLKSKIYVGVSAGSAIVGKSLALASYAIVDQEAFNAGNYAELAEPEHAAADVYGAVDFIVRPHFNRRFFFDNNLDALQKKANELRLPIYALDDNSAVKIDNESTEVISEGKYAHLKPIHAS